MHSFRPRMVLLKVLRVVAATLAGMMLATTPDAFAAEKSAETSTENSISGREIFAREWLPKDSRSHGGDGLGPVFNDSSCIACHNQGGPGGAGPATKNVTIVTATVEKHRESAFNEEQIKELKAQLLKLHPGFATARSVVLHQFSIRDDYDAFRAKFPRGLSTERMVFMRDRIQAFRSARVSNRPVGAVLKQVPPGLADESTRSDFGLGEVGKKIVAERRKVAALREKARAVVLVADIAIATQGNISTRSAQRNPTALFGAGLIDSIPNEAIEERARAKHLDPRVQGRVVRLDNGKIGRFGWKAQKATLYDFTVTACGVELGLNVPDQAQAGDPLDAKYQPTGYDLNQQEVDSLVGYLKNFPAPAQNKPSTQDDFIQAGLKAFTNIGCADCHVEKLGNVEGIYSDLLLHDMGFTSADTGSYGSFLPTSPGQESKGDFPALTDVIGGEKQVQQQQQIQQPQIRRSFDTADQKLTGASATEWRTPPLWGVRDSAPYMHDGRAVTLEQAIAVHDGEGNNSAHEFFALSSEERQQVIAFLKTLIAPTHMAAAD